MSDDDIKKLILARRAKFVAAAVAGMVACDSGRSSPMACLEPQHPDFPPPSATQPPAVPGMPVGADAGADPDAAPPRVCLRK